MSQQQSFGNGTSPGSGEISSLTPNSGSPATGDGSGNVNVYGLAANAGLNAFPIFSYTTSVSQFNLENRTYLSPYVVDPSTTDGSKGTFTTLAAAITQAIADNATGDGVTIFVRDVTINETITVATNGIKITISGPAGINNRNFGASNPIFSGSFTNSGTGAIAFNGFSISGTITNSGTGEVYINNSIVSGTLVNSSSGTLTCTSCFGNTLTGTISHGTMEFSYCGLSGGTITLSNDATLSTYYTSFSGTLAGSTSAAVSINNSYVNLVANTMSSGNIQNFNSSWSAYNYYGNAGVTYQMENSTAGNTYQAFRTAISYIVAANQDFYIGVTDTSSPITITLPAINIIKNQSFIIKDESGAAGTNNISVVVADGTTTIDGLTTYPINTNYGSIAVIYDGTNYFTM